MTAHRPHPIQGEWNGKEYDDDELAILFDDCPRCSEHAQLVVTLDDVNIRRLWDEVMQVEFTEGGRDHYRSANDSTASLYIYKLILTNQRLFGLDKNMLDAMKKARS